MNSSQPPPEYATMLLDGLKSFSFQNPTTDSILNITHLLRACHTPNASLPSPLPLGHHNGVKYMFNPEALGKHSLNGRDARIENEFKKILKNVRLIHPATQTTQARDICLAIGRLGFTNSDILSPIYSKWIVLMDSKFRIWSLYANNVDSSDRASPTFGPQCFIDDYQPVFGADANLQQNAVLLGDLHSFDFVNMTLITPSFESSIWETSFADLDLRDIPQSMRTYPATIDMNIVERLAKIDISFVKLPLYYISKKNRPTTKTIYFLRDELKFVRFIKELEEANTEHGCRMVAGFKVAGSAWLETIGCVLSHMDDEMQHIARSSIAFDKLVLAANDCLLQMFGRAARDHWRNRRRVYQDLDTYPGTTSHLVLGDFPKLREWVVEALDGVPLRLNKPVQTGRTHEVIDAMLYMGMTEAQVEQKKIEVREEFEKAKERFKSAQEDRKANARDRALDRDLIAFEDI